MQQSLTWRVTSPTPKSCRVRCCVPKRKTPKGKKDQSTQQTPPRHPTRPALASPAAQCLRKDRPPVSTRPVPGHSAFKGAAPISTRLRSSSSLFPLLRRLLLFLRVRLSLFLFKPSLALQTLRIHIYTP